MSASTRKIISIEYESADGTWVDLTPYVKEASLEFSYVYHRPPSRWQRFVWRVRDFIADFREAWKATK
jgi:hypothetical protein